MTKLQILKNATKNGLIVSFTYTKADSNDAPKTRTIKLGNNVAKRMEKINKPVKGTGNWISDGSVKKNDQKGTIFTRNGKKYVRGIDMNEKNSVVKVFCVDQMTEVKCGKDV